MIRSYHLSGYDLDAASFAAAAGGPVFLNNALLAHGHADGSDRSVHETWIR